MKIFFRINSLRINICFRKYMLPSNQKILCYLYCEIFPYYFSTNLCASDKKSKEEEEKILFNKMKKSLFSLHSGKREGNQITASFLLIFSLFYMFCCQQEMTSWIFTERNEQITCSSNKVYNNKKSSVYRVEQSFFNDKICSS